MLILGLQKTTLIDFPDHIACTIFTGGCNFRCPFCHNPELVQPDLVNQQSPIPEQDFLSWLQTRQNQLEGVCITGGEPTLHADLPDLCKKIKALGFKVKLDSNGTNPQMLKQLIEEKLVDFIAMDIKNHPAKYAETTGTLAVNTDAIQTSIDLIKNSGLPYDFRTTVSRNLHTRKDIQKIAKWLDGTKLFSLQNFQDTDKANDPNFRTGQSFTPEELSEFEQILKAHIKEVRVLN